MIIVMLIFIHTTCASISLFISNAMKHYIISSLCIMQNMLPAVAYDRHGRDYSVNGGGASSTMFLIIGVILLFLFLWFNSGDKDKK